MTTAPDPQNVEHWHDGGAHATTFMDFLTPAELDAMNAAADAMPHEPGQVLPHPDALEAGGEAVSNIDLSHRECELCYFTEGRGPVSRELFRRLEAYVSFVNDHYFGFELGAGGDRLWMLCQYGEGGHFNYHIDWGRAEEIRYRKLTAVIQMTPAHEYEGGDLEIFGGYDVFHANRAPGALTVFPSWAYHRVASVTAGTRRSCVSWHRGNNPLQ